MRKMLIVSNFDGGESEEDEKKNIGGSLENTTSKKVLGLKKNEFYYKYSRYKIESQSLQYSYTMMRTQIPMLCKNS